MSSERFRKPNDPIEKVHPSLRGLIDRALALLDEAMPLVCEPNRDRPTGSGAWDGDGLDHLQRATGELRRLIATPKQRDAELKHAMASLCRRDNPDVPMPMEGSVRQHILEMAWIDDQQCDAPGSFFAASALPPLPVAQAKGSAQKVIVKVSASKGRKPKRNPDRASGHPVPVGQTARRLRGNRKEAA